MKYFLILILIFSLTYIGRGLSKYYIDRQAFFSDFVGFLNYVLSNINFEKSKLSATVNRYNSQSNNKYTHKLLDNDYSYLHHKCDCIDCSCHILKQNEQDVLTHTLENLGKADFDTEKMNIQASIEQINQLLAQAKVENVKYGGLYTKLFLLLGLALSILLI